jgi:hypothetical protein
MIQRVSNKHFSNMLKSFKKKINWKKVIYNKHKEIDIEPYVLVKKVDDLCDKIEKSHRGKISKGHSKFDTKLGNDRLYVGYTYLKTIENGKKKTRPQYADYIRFTLSVRFYDLAKPTKFVKFTLKI